MEHVKIPRCESAVVNLAIEGDGVSADRLARFIVETKTFLPVAVPSGKDFIPCMVDGFFVSPREAGAVLRGVLHYPRGMADEALRVAARVVAERLKGMA